MFLVLMSNSDPYCGGDFEFCNDEKELQECLYYNFVYHIYKFDEKKDKDLLDYYLKKYKKAYNHKCS